MSCISFTTSGVAVAREREYRNPGKLFSYACDLQVGGAEVVSPLRDAMCLVHDDKGDGQFFQLLPEQACGINPFGRYVQEFKTAVDAVFERNDHFAPSNARMYVRGFDPSFTQIVHLVFHQCYKRGNDQCYTLDPPGREPGR